MNSPAPCTPLLSSLFIPQMQILKRNPPRWDEHRNLFILVCLPEDKMALAGRPPSSLAWSPLWYSGLQGHFQLLPQKQVRVFVTPIQHEGTLQNFSFHSPFTSQLLQLSSPVTLEEFHLPFRVSL